MRILTPNALIDLSLFTFTNQFFSCSYISLTRSTGSCFKYMTILCLKIYKMLALTLIFTIEKFERNTRKLDHKQLEARQNNLASNS